MMGQIVPSMAPPPAPQQPRPRRDRLLRLLGGLALLVPLGGCTLGRELPNVIYVAIGANKDQIINAELKEKYQVGLREVEARFRQIHPDTHFQFGLYPEDQMVEVMRQRSRSGLAPDLLLVNGDTALRLRQAGLVDPFPIRKDQLTIFNEEELGRLRSPDGRLAGLPLLVQTQLGCFNRQRLSEPPATLQELLNATANGHPMGLSLDLYYLFWIVGSTGALPAIDKAVLGQPLNPADRQALTGWLAWMQNASNQQRVTFFPDQPTAEAEFKAGRLDWIPCRSIVVPQLRQVMGSALGVAPPARWRWPPGQPGQPAAGAGPGPQLQRSGASPRPGLQLLQHQSAHPAHPHPGILDGAASQPLRDGASAELPGAGRHGGRRQPGPAGQQPGDPGALQ